MSERVLTFYLNGHLFGIDITLVKEINRSVEYTPVPDSKPYIVGLFNMRGQIVTLFDLAKLMHYEAGDLVKGSACVILKASQNDPNQVGFLIDKSRDVLEIENLDKELPPANVGGIDGTFISGVVKLKDDLLLIINPKNIFNI